MFVANQLVAWSSVYGLGLEEIDDQHKMLFDIINKTWRSIIEQAGGQVTQTLIDQLEMYTLAHFAAEETFMRVTHYPEFDLHKGEHQQFIARIAAEKKQLVASGTVSLDLLYFLKYWLIDHILLSDKAYAQFTRQARESSKGPSMLKRFFMQFWL